MFEKHKDSKESVPSAPEPRAAQPSPGAGAAPAAGVEKSTMIGKGISISGDVSADSNLKIEGVVEGRSVQTAQDVEIGETAKVTASISAKVVRIAGEVNGDIAGSERVVIARSGRVQGNIVAPRVQLEDGALFRGSIDMNPTPSADARPSSARPTAVDPGAKTSAVASAAASAAASPAGQAPEAATGGARKEPGLTFKSG
jgi:cytoskeletal protein CcmA (bactofilin family)